MAFGLTSSWQQDTCTCESLARKGGPFQSIFGAWDRRILVDWRSTGQGNCLQLINGFLSWEWFVQPQSYQFPMKVVVVHVIHGHRVEVELVHCCCLGGLAAIRPPVHILIAGDSQSLVCGGEVRCMAPGLATTSPILEGQGYGLRSIPSGGAPLLRLQQRLYLF